LLAGEQAPGIRVRWRDDVSAARQTELERKYFLGEGESPHSDAPRSLAYTPLDTSRSNLEAIVNDPEIADTNDIDRELYEVVGLRQANTLRTLIFALAGMAIAAAWIVPALRSRIAALRKGLRRDAGDVFDRIPSRFPSLASPSSARLGSDAARFLVKSVAGGLVMVAIGVPILDTWEALLLAASLLAVIFGVAKPAPWRLVAAGGLVFAVLGLKAVLPRADIAEAHNAFMVLHEGEPLEQGLPVEVFRSWKTQFDALYPREAEPDTAYSWRAEAAVPKTLFTVSADAIWRKAKYTRQVDVIDFRTLEEFRGGFANDMQHNFWTGQLSRGSIPFYVMYELTPASVGSALAWKGQAFWERANDGFEEIVHEQVAARSIASEDVGKRVYAAFFPARDATLHFRLNRSLKLWLAGSVESLLTIVGSIAILMLVIAPRWSAYLRALSMFSAGYLLIASLDAGSFLGKRYPPHGGGGDGLFHDGFGRAMAMLAGRGDIVGSLEGGEAVYWFTPGTRYIRMAEKLVFGDTNHLYGLLLACIVIIVFYLMRHFIGTRLAWLITGLFCVIPVGNLSFLQYVTNAQVGYGEAAGVGLFLLGLVLMLRSQPAWGGTDRSLSAVWMAGAALAASMFVRPNFAIAVVWLGVAYLWASWRRKDVATVIALALGLGCALWMPFHNWFYGGEFYWIARSGMAYSLPLGVGDYVSAIGDVMRGRMDSDAVAVTSQQLRGWLWNPGFSFRPALRPLAWAALGIKLLALGVTCSVVLRWVAGRFRRGTDAAVVAVAAICAHVPMLFTYTTHYRYAMLGWDLCLVVAIVWFVRPRRPSGSPAASVVSMMGILDPDGVSTNYQSQDHRPVALGHRA